MDEPLDEQYLRWLYHQVASLRLRNPMRTYWSLLRHLYTKEFIWFIPNDDNRVEDGRNLRYEFIEQNEIEPDQEWLGLGCSMLEMLIGLSRRAAFEATRGGRRDWFWILLDNLDLKEYNDAVYRDNDTAHAIDDILDSVIWRTYEWDGQGGLFPLEGPQEDQRDVEIWYQLAAYVLEHE